MRLDFPCGSDSKESACNMEDPGSVPELGRAPGKGNGNPPQNSCLEISTDRGAWWAAVYGVAESRKQLNDYTFFLSFGGTPQGNTIPLEPGFLLRVPFHSVHMNLYLPPAGDPSSWENPIPMKVSSLESGSILWPVTKSPVYILSLA